MVKESPLITPVRANATFSLSTRRKSKQRQRTGEVAAATFLGKDHDHLKVGYGSPQPAILSF